MYDHCYNALAGVRSQGKRKCSLLLELSKPPRGSYGSLVGFVANWKENLATWDAVKQFYKDEQGLLFFRDANFQP